MLQSSKLSSRFKKSNILKEQQEVIKEPEQELKPENTDKVENKDDLILDNPDFDYSEVLDLLLDKINSIPVWFEYESAKQKDLIKKFVDSRSNIADESKENLVEKLYKSVVEYGPLNFLLEKENVTSVFVNSTNSVYIEINGNILNTEIKLSVPAFNFIIKSISFLSEQNFNIQADVVNFKAGDIFISIIPSSISQSGAILILKKSVLRTHEFLVEKSMMTKEIFDFLVSVISMKKNIVIAGNINTGKTTLADALINSCLCGRRSAVIEDVPQLISSSESIIKFLINNNIADREFVISTILKMSPEYIVTDLNEPLADILGREGLIMTLKAGSVSDAFSKLVCAYAVSANLTEKYAKNKVLSEFDYIVYINKNSSGLRYVSSIVELSPARTAALSMKEIAKFDEDDGYIIDFPQPLTSIRADAVISEKGSMASRFLDQN